jgi:hypothetical protein
MASRLTGWLRSTGRAALALAAVAAFVAACGQGAGPDSVSSRPEYPGSDLSGRDCVTCHLSPNMPALNPLTSNGSGAQGKHVVHYGTWGFGCEKCHLGYTDSPTHFNGTFDTGDPSVSLVAFDSTNPSGRWINDTGPGTGECSSLDCHGADTVDWYGTGGWSLPTCTACHSSERGARRPITGAKGDFGGNASMLSHHVAGAQDPGDAQCKSCHDLSEHMKGRVRLADADTGAVIIYNSSDPSGLEPFCLSCHDSDGAGGEMSPLADGQSLGVAPYRMSAEIRTHWQKSYGHRLTGLTCLGNGQPGTGCHANGHGSAFVGILARNLTLPNPNIGPYTAAHEADYELCFGCHQSYPRVTKEVILGVRQYGNYDWDHGWGLNPPYYLPGIATMFRDRNDQGSGNFYDDVAWWARYFNLHYFHLEDWTWNYRDTYPSAASCTTCHNVHGSDTPWGWVYDEMQLQHHQGSGSDEYAALEYSDPNTLSYYPVSCTFNCHHIMPPTYMWFEPSGE